MLGMFSLNRHGPTFLHTGIKKTLQHQTNPSIGASPRNAFRPKQDSAISVSLPLEILALDPNESKCQLGSDGFTNCTFLHGSETFLRWELKEACSETPATVQFLHPSDLSSDSSKDWFRSRIKCYTRSIGGYESCLAPERTAKSSIQSSYLTLTG